ncbi:MAG: response regulator transcription factor [Polyangiales bacterium]
MQADEALELWREITRGAWTLVDRFDDRGTRFVVACRTAEHEEKPWHKLTPREREILDGIAEGRSNRRIAEMLSVSISTVAGHLAAAKRKLGVTTRVELVHEVRKRR